MNAAPYGKAQKNGLPMLCVFGALMRHEFARLRFDAILCEKDGNL